jgi:murein DD-endopeptidase MepM/ murein hydrolase activator NlpD
MAIVQDRLRGGVAAAGARALALALVCAALVTATARAGDPVEAWWPPLDRPPLDPPLEVTGDFGEYRTGHVHAGLDFATGGVTGRPVFAATAGGIVRVRASGVGYGRSIYLQAPDGRLLVYGHLDAFDEPLASYVAAAQDSSGQYEQDLWPATGALRVRAGQRLGWTGQSGAGGPHFHFEIRRVDMAYAPSRAGLPWADTLAPRIAAVWLEPLDDTSAVERSPAPRRVALGARGDTVLVRGRVRAVVDAWDPAAGGDMMGVWRTRVEWCRPGAPGAAGMCHFAEVVFDSVSWLDGMPEIDAVYDRGRATDAPRRALTPWRPPGARLRLVRSDLADSLEAGTLSLRRGDAPLTVRVSAGDLGGATTERTLVLRAPRPGEEVPDSARACTRQGGVHMAFAFDPLPGGFTRVWLDGAPAGARGMALSVPGHAPVPMVAAGARFVAVARVPESFASQAGVTLEVSGRDRIGHPLAARAALLPGVRPPLGLPHERYAPPWPPEVDVRALHEARFEPGATLVRAATREGAAPELVALSGVFDFEPALTPLRRPVTFAFTLADTTRRRAAALYQDDGSGWTHLASTWDARTGRLSAESRRLGRIGVFADIKPPRVAPPVAPRRAETRAYSRWALESALADDGSGVDARATYFVVDGRRVPSEWDLEAGVLRWKPLAPPARGTHEVEVVATDRAGNSAHRRGRVVLD